MSNSAAMQSFLSYLELKRGVEIMNEIGRRPGGIVGGIVGVGKLTPIIGHEYTVLASDPVLRGSIQDASDALVSVAPAVPVYLEWLTDPQANFPGLDPEVAREMEEDADIYATHRAMWLHRINDAFRSRLTALVLDIQNAYTGEGEANG